MGLSILIHFPHENKAQFLQFCSALRHKPFRILIMALLGITAKAAHGQQFPLEERSSIANNPQKSDSIAPIKRSDPRWQYANLLFMGKDTFHPWDSAFPVVQRYNKIQRTGLPYADLGNTGSPQLMLRYSSFAPAGFQTGLNPFPFQNKNIDSFKFHKAAVPFSNFSYVQGSRGVFILDALHTQNFAPNWNLTIDFSSVQNQDVYPKSGQNNLHRGTMAGSRFVSRKGNFSQTVLFSWNRGRRAETRGLYDDTAFFRPSKAHERVVGNYIPSSQTAQSFYAQRHHVIEHLFYPGKQRNMSVFHRFDWIKEKYEYNESATAFSDADSVLYNKPPNFQTGKFKDSSVWVQWNNSFGMVGKIEKAKIPLFVRAWYAVDKIAYNGIYKTAASTTFNQSIHGKIHAQSQRLEANAVAEAYFAGWNSGNYLLAADAKFKVFNQGGLMASYRNQRNRPAFISERFSGNYLLYNQNRLQITSNALVAGGWWRNKFFAFRGDFTTGTASNALYLGSDGNFAQVNRINFANFTGNVLLNFGHFHLSHLFTLQTHNQKNLIPVPTYSGLSSIYFEGNLFKKAMYARCGFDIRYISEYKGYQYQPMNATFFPGTLNTGNYPYLDVFFSGEVKTLMFFVKIEHVNHVFANYGFQERYYSALYFPNEPFQFRFGITWKFYN